MYKECLFSSYKNRAEAVELMDIGIGRTCQPIIPCEYPETRVIVLPVTEDHTIISSFVWTKHQNVTDGRTDRSAVAVA